MAGQNEIKTTITLDGTKRVESDLRNIGTTAEQTGRKVSQSLDGAKIGSGFSASMANLQKSLKAIGTSMQSSAKLASKGIQDISKGLGSIKTAATGAATKVALIGAAFAGVAVLAEKLATSAADTAESIQNQADAFGVSFRKMQQLRDAMRETGADEALLEKSILRIGSFDQFEKFAQDIGRMTNSQQQLNAVIDTFGKKGAVQLLAFLRSYSDSLDEGRQKTLRLIPALNDVGQTDLLTLDQASDRMFTNFDRLRLLVGAELAPTFTRLFDIVRKATGDWGPLFARAFGTLSDAINIRLKQSGGSISQWLGDISAWVIGVVLDIAKMIAGFDDSKIDNKWLLALRDGAVWAWETLKYVFTDALPNALVFVREKADWAAKKLNELFGGKLTGDTLLFYGAIFTLVGGFKLLNGAVQTLLGLGRLLYLLFATPAGWVVLAIAGVALLAYEIYTHWDEITAATDELIAWLEQKFTDFKAWVNGLWDGAISYFKRAWKSASDWLGDLFKGVIANIKSNLSGIGDMIFGGSDSGGSSTGGGSGHASGGPITGPGTGTSDSILARLSNGEYVINAKSAGLLGRRFLDAINGIRSSSVLRNGLPGFATGGFVGTPSFAIAGSSGRPVNLTIGGESFSMSAADDVAERLVKYAGRAKVRSAGRKPAWYGA